MSYTKYAVIFLILKCGIIYCERIAKDDWLIQFDKLEQNNPILGPLDNTSWICPIRNESILWEEKDVFNPAAVVRDGKVYVLYRAEDKIGNLAGTSRIGLAWSDDGINFNNRMTTPVLYPDEDSNIQYEWEGGCEDPRVVEAPDGTYIMTYTSYDGTARLSVATSKDLIRWDKHGPAFTHAHDESYVNAWTKSGSIVVEPQPDGRLVAVKINGTYWMYWGENHIYTATSKDLINWDPVLGSDKGFYRGRPDHHDHPVDAVKPKSVLRPRKGKFDSNLVEPGPPAILRQDGILFIYNSRNTDCPEEPGRVCPKGIADPKLAPGTYSAGQALFSRTDPTLLIARSQDTFFKPTADFEITGQVGNVVFLQGLVYFKRQWFLYYGTADSKIAVAVTSKYDHSGLLRPSEDLASEEGAEEEEEDFYGLEPDETLRRLERSKKAQKKKQQETVVSTIEATPAPLADIGDPEPEYNGPPAASTTESPGEAVDSPEEAVPEDLGEPTVPQLTPAVTAEEAAIEEAVALSEESPEAAEAKASAVGLSEELSDV